MLNSIELNVALCNMFFAHIDMCFTVYVCVGRSNRPTDQQKDYCNLHVNAAARVIELCCTSIIGAVLLVDAVVQEPRNAAHAVKLRNKAGGWEKEEEEWVVKEGNYGDSSKKRLH